MEMLRSVLVNGIVATADVPALETQSQVYPLVPARQTFLAAVRGLGLNVAHLREMLALLGHGWKLFPQMIVFKS
jgi:hypothetical protein